MDGEGPARVDPATRAGLGHDVGAQSGAIEFAREDPQQHRFAGTQPGGRERWRGEAEQIDRAADQIELPGAQGGPPIDLVPEARGASTEVDRHDAAGSIDRFALWRDRRGGARGDEFHSSVEAVRELFDDLLRGLGLSALGLHGLKPRHLGYVAAGVAISWVAIIAYGTLVELIGLDGLLPQSTVPADEQFFDTPAPIVVGAVLILGFAPISEELFFRGFVFPGLVPRWGWVMAGLGSGLMFASIHFDIGSIVPFTIIGFVLAWLYHRTGTVWAPIAMHFVFNAISFAAIVASDLS